jgi:uncharacterized membrane protein YccC
MMVALYAAFWLQLDNAWSAAVTVSILSMQTRGQTYQRAVYWVFAAIIGVVVSLTIGGLFPQSRVLFVIGLACWLGLCVYAANLFDSNKAYAAILCGYTVAQVAVPQIDSPQNIFLAGINRGAAIVVGIVALVLVSDPFAAPNLHAGLAGKLAAAHQRVRAFALAILRGERVDRSTRRICWVRSRLFTPTSRRSPLNRATDAREAWPPGAPSWRWSPRSAQRARCPRCPARACLLFSGSSAGLSIIPSERRVVRCGFACSSRRMAPTQTRRSSTDTALTC